MNQIEFAQEFLAKIALAKKNGHQLGYMFYNNIIFCKKCNAPLTFIQQKRIQGLNDSHNLTIDGLHGSQCNE